MPPDETLPARVVADFRTWIASGAPDPRVESVAATKPVDKADPTGADSWAYQPPARSYGPREQRRNLGKE